MASSTAGATGKAPLEAQSRLTPQLPPDARERHRLPSKGAALEPKWLLSLSLSFSSCLRMLCCKTRLDLCCQPSIMHSEGMLARMSSSCLQLGAPLATMPDGLRMQLTEHHSPVVTSHVFRNASRFGSNSNSRNSTGAGLLVYSEVHEIKGLSTWLT